MPPCRHDPPHLPPPGQPYAPPYCRLCWLYATDHHYQELWDNIEAPHKDRTAPCQHLGEIVNKLDCACPAKWIRECKMFKLCTIELCKECSEYAPAVV